MKPVKALTIGLLLTTQISFAEQLMRVANTEVAQEEIAKTVSTEEDMAKKLANPVAALISLPFQFNYETGYNNTSGNDSAKFTLNVQPVIPISINDDWNLISRTILPIVRTDNLPIGSGINGGVGDIVQSLFFSPKEPTEDGWIWGVGPVFLIPSGSDVSIEKWGAGPTGVALKQVGAWSYGMLANHIWSTGGSDEFVQNINNTFLQPFFTYTTEDGFSATFKTETTYNWEADSENDWTVPLIVVLGQVSRIGDQLVEYAVGAQYYAESPVNGPKGWSGRFVFTMMFPK